MFAHGIFEENQMFMKSPRDNTRILKLWVEYQKCVLSVFLFTIVRQEPQSSPLISASDLVASISVCSCPSTHAQPVRLDIEYDAIVPDVRLVDDEIDFGEVTTGMQEKKTFSDGNKTS